MKSIRWLSRIWIAVRNGRDSIPSPKTFEERHHIVKNRKTLRRRHRQSIVNDASIVPTLIVDELRISPVRLIVHNRYSYYKITRVDAIIF